MIKINLIIAIIFSGLIISGCIDHSNQIDMQMNSTNATTNVAVNISEQIDNTTNTTEDGFSLVFNLNEPPEEVIGVKK